MYTRGVYTRVRRDVYAQTNIAYAVYTHKIHRVYTKIHRVYMDKYIVHAR